MTALKVVQFTPRPKRDKNAARTNPRRQRVYFSPAQIRAYMRAARAAGPREYALSVVGLSHGCRVSELCDLRLGDIKFERNTIHIRRKKNSEDSLQPMSPKEVAALRDWLKVRPEVDSDVVFVSREASGSKNTETEPEAKYRMSRSQIFRIFQSICETADIPKSHWHCHVLKHSLAKMLLAKGENAFTVQKALGHKSIQSTLAYSRPSDFEAGAAIVSALKGAW
ncbi:MAG: tyrosine-type recombinase/integrase [Candidatus Acidiferrales bacterium]